MKTANASNLKFYTPESYQPQMSVAYLMLRNKSIYQRVGDVKLAELGVTAAHMSVMVIISHAEFSTISSVSQALGVDPAAIVRVVQKLVSMKLIRKEQSKKDGRVIGLSLTADGIKITKLIAPVWCDLLNQSLSGFTKKEFEQLKDFLFRIEKNNLLQLEDAL